MTARLSETELTGKPASKQASTSQMSGEKGQRKTGKRPGRKPVKIDHKAKLERSRQSARECRARKKLRYQYIEELVANREKAVFALREELQTYKEWCEQVDSGIIAEELKNIILEEKEEEIKNQPNYLPYSTTCATNTTTLGQVYSPINPSVSSSSSQHMFVNEAPYQQMNISNVGAYHGASNYAVNSPPSYIMPNLSNVSQMSEKEQIHSWYLFLKNDEERFSRDGSHSGSSGTPQPTEASVASTCTSSVPSVVTDYLDLSSSSDSSYS